MKLIDFGVDESGWILDIFKFKRRSVIEFTYEAPIRQSFPCLMVQLGPDDLFFCSISFVRFVFNVSLWSNHYDY